MVDVTVDLFASRRQGSRPEPAGVALAHGKRGLPLMITSRVEVGTVHVELLRLILPPTELRGNAVLRNKLPDQPTPKMQTLVPVRETLICSKTNRREALA